DAYVTLRDLSATIMTLLGDADHGGFLGTSLSVRWDASGTTSGPTSPIFSETSEGKSVDRAAQHKTASLIDEGYQYMVKSDGDEELYDLRSDPGERINLAHSAPPDVLVRLRAKLRDIVSPNQ